MAVSAYGQDEANLVFYSCVATLTYFWTILAMESNKMAEGNLNKEKINNFCESIVLKKKLAFSQHLKIIKSFLILKSFCFIINCLSSSHLDLMLGQ